MEFRDRIRESFERQALMRLMGARLGRIDEGAVDITLPFRPDLTQHTGVLAAGTLTAIADTACGYAAFTLMAEDEEVLSIELKVNFLRPARGGHFTAEGRVVQSGSTVVTTRGDVFGEAGASRELVAMMVATMIRRRGQVGR